MDVSAFRRVPRVAARAAVVGLAAALLAATGAAAKPKTSPPGRAKHGDPGKPKPVMPGASVTSVASGLDNPRGLSFGPNGTLYVAEAGHGGSDCLAPAPPPPEEPTCVGFTGGIGAIGRSGVDRVVSGIMSIAERGGFGATGLDGVSAHGNGGLYAVITESIPGIERATEGAGLPPEVVALAKTQAGRLIQANPSGHWREVADVGSFDFRWSEQHFAEHEVSQPPDANPYAVLVEGAQRFVVDAATNVVDEVRPNGSIRVLAFIPNPGPPNPFKTDSVPTCIDRGPDGALYVGELTGVGNGPETSVVWRIGASGALEQWASGLTGVTGCGFGADGQFYATEFSTLGWETFTEKTGAVVRVAPHSSTPTVVVEGLSFPNGFAAGSDGSLYVSNWSIAPAEQLFPGAPTGEVVRITP